MTRPDELETALLNPIEDLSFEYKNWLNLGENPGKATLAKAVIALANADGGCVIIGYEEDGDTLRSIPRPEGVREITQDLVNGAIRRYADPEFHVRMEIVENAETGIRHPVIIVPSTATTPVLAKRDCEDILKQARVYVRWPGPRSEEPRTVEEWRTLLDRYVRRSRTSMLDAIRSIVEGRVGTGDAAPSLKDRLSAFATSSRERHDALLDEARLPPDSVARMPLGSYEMGFALEGAEPAPSLGNLMERIEQSHEIKLTGWPAFLVMTRRELRPRPVDGAIEAWLGCPDADRFMGEDAAHSDFWRIAPDGLLYTRTGYDEDGASGRAEPGSAFDFILPVWRVGEALLYAHRLAATYEGVERILAWVRWSGLQGRTLKAMSGGFYPLSRDRISHTATIEKYLLIEMEQIDDNLPEVIQTLIAPIYEAFEFYQLPRETLEQQLEELMRRR